MTPLNPAPHRSPMPRALVPLVLFLAACGGPAGETPGVVGDTIYVGALAPLSDPVAVIGKPLLRGIQTYLAKVNAEGGIAGRYQVRVLEEDVVYVNPSTSVQKYQKIKDRVAMFTMILGTDHIYGVLPLLREDQVLAVPVTLDAEWVRDPNLIPAGAPYHIQVINGVGYWLDQPGNAGKTVCSMVLATGYGEAVEEGLDYAAREMGFTPGAKARFRQDDQDFVAPITQLRNARCDAVMLGSLPSVTGKVLGAAAQLGYAPRWMMTSPSWHGVLATSPLADYLERNAWVVAEGTGWDDTTEAGVRELQDALATYAPDQPPDYYFAFGWMAGAATAEHLRAAVEAGDLTREGFSRALGAMQPIAAAGWREYRYGPADTREPPRIVTVFRVSRSRPFGMQVEARDIEVPAARSFQFTRKR